MVGGDLVEGEPPEPAQLDDARLTLRELGEAFESLVEREHVDLPDAEVGAGHVVELDPLPLPSPLGGIASTRVLDEDASHHLGRNGQEVASVVEIGQLLAELQEGLVNDRRGLEGVTGLLRPHETAGQGAELAFQQAPQAISRLQVPRHGGLQRSGRLTGFLRAVVGHFACPRSGSAGSRSKVAFQAVGSE